MRYFHQRHVYSNAGSETAPSGAPDIGPSWAHTEVIRYFEGRAASIAGGSDEIQRNIIAKHVLKI